MSSDVRGPDSVGQAEKAEYWYVERRCSQLMDES